VACESENYKLHVYCTVNVYKLHVYCTVNERSGLEVWNADMETELNNGWGTVQGNCPLCSRGENPILKCSRQQR
jgi:hypothetical protein